MSLERAAKVGGFVALVALLVALVLMLVVGSGTATAWFRHAWPVVVVALAVYSAVVVVRRSRR